MEKANPRHELEFEKVLSLVSSNHVSSKEDSQEQKMSCLQPTNDIKTTNQAVDQEMLVETIKIFHIPQMRSKCSCWSPAFGSADSSMSSWNSVVRWNIWFSSTTADAKNEDDEVRIQISTFMTTRTLQPYRFETLHKAGVSAQHFKTNIVFHDDTHDRNQCIETCKWFKSWRCLKLQKVFNKNPDSGSSWECAHNGINIQTWFHIL